MLAQKNLYEQIGRINKDVAEKVMLRRREEKRMLEENVEFAIKYNELAKDRSRVTGIEADALEMRLGSLVQAMEYNQKMMTMAREASNVEMEMAKKRYEEDHKWYNFALQQSKNIFGLKTEEFSMTKSIGDQILKLNVASEAVAYTWGAILVMLKGAYNLFNKMDKAAWDFRKAMGMTRNESAVIRKDAQRIAIDYMHLGVTIESAYKSYQVLGKMVGGVHNVSKSLVEEVALMAAQLQISEETSAGFLRNMAAISRSTMESQTAMMYIAKDMSNAAGVPLDDVMKNVADRSKNTLTMMSRVPNVALRSAIELQRMGTSLKQAASSSRHILDFTENINEEMEASVLLGRSINLQRAREMAYNRNLEGSTKEILRITKSINFEQLDVFQQEAYAKATGKSVDELLNMLQTDRQLEHVKRRGTKEQQAQLKLYEKMRNENAKAAKERAKDASILLRTMNNQTRLAAISAKWNQILAQAQEWLLPVIDGMLAMVIPALDIARGLFAWSGALKIAVNVLKPIFFFFWDIGKVIGRIGKAIQTLSVEIRSSALWNLGARFRTIGATVTRFLLPVQKAITGFFAPIARFFAAIGRFFAPVGKMFSAIGRFLAPIGKLFGLVGKFTGFIGFFAKWIPILGWVITAFQFIGNLIGRMKGIGDAFNKGFFHGIWFGLKAIVGALYDTLIKPFVSAFKYIWSFFGGKSPSKLGLGIWNGIKSIGAMLFRAITLPWRLAFTFIIHLGQWAGKMAWAGIRAYFTMWRSLGVLVYDGAKYLGKQIIKGIKTVKEGVKDAILWPFRAAWGSVVAMSNVGVSIVKGVASVGKRIFDAIIAPYKAAFKWVIDKFAKIPFIGKLLGGDAKGSVEKKATAAYVPAVKVTPKGTEVAPFTRKPGEKGKDDKEKSMPMSEATGLKICSLLEKILAKDSHVKMDGQLLSSHLARQTEFRGGYGVNKVA